MTDPLQEAGLGVRHCPPCDGLCNQGRNCVAANREFKPSEWISPLTFGQKAALGAFAFVALVAGWAVLG